MCLSILCIQHVFLQRLDGIGSTRNKHIHVGVVIFCLNMDIFSNALVRLVIKVYINTVCLCSTPLPFPIFSFPSCSSSFPSFPLLPFPSPSPSPRPLPMLPCLLHSLPLPQRLLVPSSPPSLAASSFYHFSTSTFQPAPIHHPSPRLTLSLFSLFSLLSSHIPLYLGSFR